MAMPTGVYNATTTGLTVSGTTPFLQVQAAATHRVEILEIVVFQTNITTIEMNAVQFERGTTGGGGAAVTEREWDVGGAAPATVVVDNGSAITAATSLDLDYARGWNILQEGVFLPTPKYPLVLAASDRLDLSMLNAPGASLTLGCSLVWEEYGV